MGQVGKQRQNLFFNAHKAQYRHPRVYLSTLNHREPFALARTALKRQPCRSAVYAYAEKFYGELCKKYTDRLQLVLETVLSGAHTWL